MEVEKTLMLLVESQVNLMTKMAEVIESNDRLTKALIESYSEPEDEEVPRTYMDGSEVK